MIGLIILLLFVCLVGYDRLSVPEYVRNLMRSAVYLLLRPFRRKKKAQVVLFDETELREDEQYREDIRTA